MPYSQRETLLPPAPSPLKGSWLVGDYCGRVDRPTAELDSKHKGVRNEHDIIGSRDRQVALPDGVMVKDLWGPRVGQLGRREVDDEQ